jgi:hypothetical protein
MATFISTTLTKRTGATTTVFAPTILDGGLGTLLEAGSTYTWQAPSMTLKQSRSASSRTTTVRIYVPQLDGSTPPVVLSRPYIECKLYVPDGTAQTDVDDLVGYLNAFTDSSLANGDDLLVNGLGVF